MISCSPPQSRFGFENKKSEIWLPLALDEARERTGNAISLLHALARLKPGVTPAQAQAELQTIAQRIQPQGPPAPLMPDAVPFRLQPDLLSDPAFETPTPGNLVPAEIPPGVVEIGPGGVPPGLSRPFDQAVKAPAPGQKMVTLPFPGPGAGPPPDLGQDMIEIRSAGPPLPGGDGTIKLVALHEQIVANVKPALLVLLGAVGFVLLIACAICWSCSKWRLRWCCSSARAC